MLALFGVVLVFIVYVPVKFIKWVEPDFLPYRVFAISDEPLNHVSLELVTLQGKAKVFSQKVIFSFSTDATGTDAYQNFPEGANSALG